ncbi:MAG: M20/M25/M40 family metallo-hydrolase [Bacilli bacterium]|jgi:hypothetical protein
MNKPLLKITSLAIALALVSCTPSTTETDTSSISENDSSSPIQDVSELISSENAQEHIQYLSGTEIGGRASGSTDNLLACQYVADYFEDHGLSPYSEETGYFQPYLQQHTRIFSEYFSFEVTNSARTSLAIYRYAYDFTFFYANFSAFGYVSSGLSFDDQADLVVFSNIEANYADKIVLVSNITSAILTDLYNDGAKGAIVLDSKVSGYPITEYGQGDMFDETDFLMLYAAPQTYNALINNISNGLNKADVSYEIDNATKTVNNVVGILDVGATNNIIVSAHIDHLGRFDAEDDGYYAGALDNASGVAGMLELARIYSQNAERLSKNVIFIAYNGEEAGLFGSQYYSNNMVGERAETRAAFNLDMIGGGSNDYDLEIIGYAGGLTGSINTKCQEFGIENYTIYTNQANSDHYWLGDMNIVSLSFVHFDDRYYHRPADTEDKINYDIFVNQLSMIASLMLSSYNK